MQAKSWASFALALLVGCGAAAVEQVDAFEAARVDSARVQARQLVAAAEMFALQNQKCASSGRELQDSRVIDRLEPDPWGQDFVLVCTETDGGMVIEVSSLGPDAKPGTADDVRVSNE